MSRHLVLRFDAPLMSFGGVAIDHHAVTRTMPTRSLLTGLLGNALGYSRVDGGALTSLQERLCYAARRERKGAPLRDYQTVDLGQEWMRWGWTTRGEPAVRSGSVSEGTHIRLRDYLADAIFLVALCLEGEGGPNIDDLAGALRRPARPLFLGRKCCLPAGPIFDGFAEGATPLEALRARPLGEGSDPIPYWWTNEPGAPRGDFSFYVTDDRDWENGVHAGRRAMHYAIKESHG